MSAKHTPGPWAVDVMPGEVVVYEAVTLKNIDICKMGGNNNDGANARLIAAAPDMLAALQASIALADKNRPRFDVRGAECQSVYDMCVSAIAKTVKP